MIRAASGASDSLEIRAFDPYREHAYRGAGTPPERQHRGSGARRGRVGVTRLVLTDFRNYRSARLELDAGPAAGRVDRAERRRQDQPVGGDVVSLALAAACATPGSAISTGATRADALSALGLGGRGDDRHAARPVAIGTGGDGAAGRAPRRAHRRRAGAPAGGARRAARRAVADAGDGPAVCRRPGGAAAAARPAGARARSGACDAGCPLRAGPARALAAAARRTRTIRPGSTRWRRRWRREGSRSPRRGARRSSGSTAPAPKPTAPFRGPA